MTLPESTNEPPTTRGLRVVTLRPCPKRGLLGCVRQRVALRGVEVQWAASATGGCSEFAAPKIEIDVKHSSNMHDHDSHDNVGKTWHLKIMTRPQRHPSARTTGGGLRAVERRDGSSHLAPSRNKRAPTLKMPITTDYQNHDFCRFLL